MTSLKFINLMLLVSLCLWEVNGKWQRGVKISEEPKEKKVSDPSSWNMARHNSRQKQNNFGSSPNRTIAERQQPIVTCTVSSCGICIPIDSRSGVIRSRSYPSDYGINLFCLYTLTVNKPGCLLKLTFLEFKVENGFDFLAVSPSPPGSPFTGYSLPPVIQTTGQLMTVNFKADSRNCHYLKPKVYNWEAFYELDGCQKKSPESSTKRTTTLKISTLQPTITTPELIRTTTSELTVPTTPEFTTPTTPELTDPTTPEFTTPTTPELTAPTTPEFTTPTTPELTAPTTPELTAPTTPEFTTPTTPELTAPTTPELTAPTTPEFTTPTSPELPTVLTTPELIRTTPRGPPTVPTTPELTTPTITESQGMTTDGLTEETTENACPWKNYSKLSKVNYEKTIEDLRNKINYSVSDNYGQRQQISRVHVTCSTNCTSSCIEFDSVSGLIQSNLWPMDYGANPNCIYRIAVSEPGHILKLEFVDFIVEEKMDFVKVYSASNTFTGYKLPPIISTNSTEMTVLFLGDYNNCNIPDKYNKTGKWQARYQLLL